jgi:hypothetical protein
MVGAVGDVRHRSSRDVSSKRRIEPNITERGEWFCDTISVLHKLEQVLILGNVNVKVSAQWSRRFGVCLKYRYSGCVVPETDRGHWRVSRCDEPG